jgi:hypothetical protein
MPPHGSKLLPRSGLPECLGKAGHPIALSTLNQLCARGEGPPAAGVWAGRYFYDPDLAIKWARDRFRKSDLTKRANRATRAA